MKQTIMTPSEEKDLENNIVNQPKKKVSKDFMQISLQGLDYISELIEKSPSSARVLMMMFKFCNANNTVYISQSALAEMIGTKRTKTIADAVRTLKENGFITIYKFKRVNFYFINPQIATCTNAQYKKKIIEEYQANLHYPLKELEIDTNKIYKQEDTIKLNVAFYKSHPELQSPETESQEEKEFKQAQEEEYNNNAEYRKDVEKSKKDVEKLTEITDKNSEEIKKEKKNKKKKDKQPEEKTEQPQTVYKPSENNIPAGGGNPENDPFGWFTN